MKIDYPSQWTFLVNGRRLWDSSRLNAFVTFMLYFVSQNCIYIIKLSGKFSWTLIVIIDYLLLSLQHKNQWQKPITNLPMTFAIQLLNIFHSIFSLTFSLFSTLFFSLTFSLPRSSAPAHISSVWIHNILCNSNQKTFSPLRQSNT